MVWSLSMKKTKTKMILISVMIINYDTCRNPTISNSLKCVSMYKWDNRSLRCCLAISMMITILLLMILTLRAPETTMIMFLWSITLCEEDGVKGPHISFMQWRHSNEVVIFYKYHKIAKLYHFEYQTTKFKVHQRVDNLTASHYNIFAVASGPYWRPASSLYKWEFRVLYSHGLVGCQLTTLGGISVHDCNME